MFVKLHLRFSLSLPFHKDHSLAPILFLTHNLCSIRKKHSLVPFSTFNLANNTRTIFHFMNNSSKLPSISATPVQRNDVIQWKSNFSSRSIFFEGKKMIDCSLHYFTICGWLINCIGRLNSGNNVNTFNSYPIHNRKFP